MKNFKDINKLPEWVSKNKLKEIAQEKASPCITLMMPVHSTPPDVEGNPIVFKNLLRDLHNMAAAADMTEAVGLVENLELLKNDRDFWNQASPGLMIFHSPEYFRAIRVPVALTAKAMVDNHFHLNTLRRYFQESNPFQILALGLDSVRLWEGNRHHLREVNLEGKVPVTMVEALGEELTNDYQHSGGDHPGTGMSSNRHGTMEKSQERDSDQERFFRVIDQAVEEHFSRTSGLPLILAALPQHHTIFRQVTKNSLLHAHGIKEDASKLGEEDLKNKAWEVLKPAQDQMIQDLLVRQQQAFADGLGESSLSNILKDSIAGKVETLLLEENRRIPGRIQANTGTILEDDDHEDANPDSTDILEELASMVEAFGGKVVFLPSEIFPEQSGAVTINRF